MGEKSNHKLNANLNYIAYHGALIRSAANVAPCVASNKLRQFQGILIAPSDS